MPSYGPAVNAPLAPKQVAAAAKRAQVVQLRIAGASMQQIRERLGYSTAGVYKALHTALKEQRDVTEDAVAELRQVQVMRLDAMIMALWPKIQAGDTQAVEKVIQIEARRAKLLGLDAPTRLDSSGWVRATDTSIGQAIATAIAHPADEGEQDLSALTEEELARLYQRLKGTRSSL